MGNEVSEKINKIRIVTNIIGFRSTKNRAWCTVRSAIITFIIILIIILAVAVAVGIVFGVLGGQLNQNGNGARTTNQQNSCRTISSYSQCDLINVAFSFSDDTIELYCDD